MSNIIYTKDGVDSAISTAVDNEAVARDAAIEAQAAVDTATYATVADAETKAHAAALRASFYNVVVDGGATPGGDMGAIVTAAATTLKALGGGVIYIPPGDWNFTTTGVVDDRRVTVQGAGSAVCRLRPQAALGSAPCLDINGTSAFSILQAGRNGGYYIIGIANPTGIGLRYGDLTGGHLDDVSCDGFNGAGGVGLQFINRVNWTERTVLTRVALGQSLGNATNWDFKVSGGTESFGYTRALDVRINIWSMPVTASVASCTLTNGSTSITVASGGFPGVTAGMALQRGVGGFAGIAVASVSGNTLTASLPLNTSATETLYFAPTAQLAMRIGAGVALYHSTLTIVCNAAGGTYGTSLFPAFLFNAAGSTSTGYGLDTSEVCIQGETDGKVVSFISSAANSATRAWGFIDFPGLASGVQGSNSVVELGGHLWCPGLLTPTSDVVRSAHRAFANVTTDYVLASYIQGSGNFNSYTMKNTGEMGWGSGAAAVDVGVKRAAAGVLALTNGSTGGAAQEFIELAADPAAPAVNGARLFTKDNGSGKTQLCVRFNTGATVVIATEP